MYVNSNANLLCNMLCVIIYIDDQFIYLSDIALHLVGLYERHTRIKDTKQSDEYEIMIDGSDHQTRTQTHDHRTATFKLHKSLMHTPLNQHDCAL